MREQTNIIDDVKYAEDGLFSLRGNLDGYDKHDFKQTNQFIGFFAGNEEFLLPLHSIKEINSLTRLTFVPSAPKYVAGVVNLRGNIIPAVDFKEIIGLPNSTISSLTRLIIINVEEFIFGLIVDGISTVVSLKNSEIETNSLISNTSANALVTKIANHGNTMRGIIDPARVLKAISEGNGDVTP